ncbi:MAG: hypothetical protein ABIS50_04125 [Luteolibacter sp.]|uniref:hypothetical protein n=1 Tax=Luteolibacter sp. TaxID=1962973 RepID=UPI0032651F05
MGSIAAVNAFAHSHPLPISKPSPRGGTFRLLSAAFALFVGSTAIGHAAESVQLRDYNPLHAKGSTWVYSRFESPDDKNPSATKVTLVEESIPISLYNGLEGQISYAVNAIKSSEERGHLLNGEFVPANGKDDWKVFVYTAASGGYRYYGNDRVVRGSYDKIASTFRVANGFRVPNDVFKGNTVNDFKKVYGDGKLLGAGLFAFTYLGKESVTVPAGTFDDCIHLRFQLGKNQNAEIGEEWWARGVGLVKWRGITGEQKGISETLVSMDLKKFVPFKPADIKIGGPNLTNTTTNWYNLQLPEYVGGSAPVSATFTITNRGTQVLKDLSVEISPNDYFTINPFRTRNLKGGESVNVTVRLSSPTPTFEANAIIRVRSSDPQVDGAVVQLYRLALF